MGKSSRIYRLSALLIALVLLSTGCAVQEAVVLNQQVTCSEDEIFMIGDLVCAKQEYLAYLANYYNLYGTVCEVNLWTGGYDTDTMAQSIKDAVFSHIIKVYVLNIYAQENEITLTETDKAKAAKAAAAYYESLSEEEIAYMGDITEEQLAEIYERYVLAEKVYAQIMKSVNGEVSEDEARIMDALVLHVTDEELANEIQAELDNGATFERLANSYNEDELVSVTFGRGVYDSAVEAVAFYLEDGEVSDMITTESDGYYFIQCVNKYNEELSEANKEAIIEERQALAMEECMSGIQDVYYSELNSECLESLDLPNSENITTSSLFTTLNSYISY